MRSSCDEGDGQKTPCTLHNMMHEIRDIGMDAV